MIIKTEVSSRFGGNNFTLLKCSRFIKLILFFLHEDVKKENSLYSHFQVLCLNLGLRMPTLFRG